MRGRSGTCRPSLSRMGQQHGLERGIEGSKAKHTTIKQHYAAISKPVPKPEFRPESVQPKIIKKPD